MPNFSLVYLSVSSHKPLLEKGSDTAHQTLVEYCRTPGCHPSRQLAFYRARHARNDKKARLVGIIHVSYCWGLRGDGDNSDIDATISPTRAVVASYSVRV